jgi:sucrose phosphorylase
MFIKNKVQLITYPDSLGGNLKALNYNLNKYFLDIFKGGIHILPPFPSSGDRGFAPLTYLEIDKRFGSWQDIKEISKNFNVLLDLMVNHISKESEYFKDFLKKGTQSSFADLFITLDKIWPNSKVNAKDMEKVLLRRKEPFSHYNIENSQKKITVWTSFGQKNPSEQIDLDVNSRITKKLIVETLVNFHENNVKIVRLDAVGYITKKPGTTCFFIEPEIYQFLNWIKNKANPLDLKILPEVHAHYKTQFKLVQLGYWIYDFILPYLILDCIINKKNRKLLKYLKIRPEKQFTMLDCHDGVPVKPDLDDIITAEEARKIVDICLKRGSNLSRILSPNHMDKDGFDVHQINCSYYSVLDCDDDAYIAARAIQFFVPGIPQVYYVGLLAGENDLERVERTGEGREINRHNYTDEEIVQALQKNVVKRVLKLIRFRNEYSAFNGKFTLLDSSEDKIILSWKKDDKACTLNIDLKTNNTFINYINETDQIVTYYV